MRKIKNSAIYATKHNKTTQNVLYAVG